MGGWKWRAKNCCYVWSGHRPDAESEPRIDQQDFKRPHLSKTRPAARRPPRRTCQNQVHLIDAPPDGHIRTPSRPHVATIFYTPFSTTHFYLLITGLILTHIPESFNPNLVETQNIILNPKKRVGALLKFRVQETRKTCKIFIEMEEVQSYATTA